MVILPRRKKCSGEIGDECQGGAKTKKLAPLTALKIWGRAGVKKNVSSRKTMEVVKSPGQEGKTRKTAGREEILIQTSTGTCLNNKRKGIW